MDSFSDDSDSSEGPTWIEMFTGYKGHEFFCEVDKEYILDRFNLTGLANEVTNNNYQVSLELICDRAGKLVSWWDYLGLLL